MKKEDRDLRPSTIQSLAIGAVAGFLSGLFGVGGGILIVPALAIFTRMDQRLAHGTSLAATGPLALAGLIGYAVAGEVDWLVAGLLLVGSVLGAIIGTSLLRGMSSKWLAYGFVLLLVATAVRLLIGTPVGIGRGDIEVAEAAGLAGIGLFTGSIAGLMGVGGGIVMVPAQILLYSIPSVLAKGTSLAVIVPTALVGTTRNLRHGNVDMGTALRVGLAGALFSFMASRVSLGLDPRTSSVLFGVLLVSAGARLLLNQRK